MDTVYNTFMYPEGISAMAEAVDMVAKEEAPVIPQTEDGATYDPFLNKPGRENSPKFIIYIFSNCNFPPQKTLEISNSCSIST